MLINEGRIPKGPIPPFRGPERKKPNGKPVEREM